MEERQDKIYNHLIQNNESYRKKQRFWRIIALIAIAYITLFSDIFNKIQENRRESIAHIAKISISGVIEYNPKILEVLRYLKNNPKVKAVLIEIDSPGGKPVAAEALFAEISATSKEKPVVTIMLDEATSAAYWVAVASDRIFARNTTITGSIGAILQGFNFHELLKKIGVENFTIKSGKNKGISSFEKISQENIDSLQKVVNDIYQIFLDYITKKRNFNQENSAKLKETFDGRVFTGRQALKLQLIDEIGGESEALTWLEKRLSLGKMDVINYYTSPKSKVLNFIP